MSYLGASQFTAAGIPRFTSSGSVMDGPNPYLATLVAPDALSSEIPDSNSTLALLKVANGSEIIETPATQNIAFLQCWRSPDRTIKVCTFYDGKWYWIQDLVDPEDLADNFKQFRLISACTSVVSSSVTGNNFEVSGSINSVKLEDLPKVFGNGPELRFETIPSYAADARSVVAGQPAHKGVMTVAPPSENHEYVVPATNNSAYTDKLYNARTESVVSAAPDGPAPAGWVRANPAANVDTVVFDSDNAPGFLAPNIYGNTIVTAQIQCASGITANTNAYASLVYTTERYDTGTDTVVTTDHTTTVIIPIANYVGQATFTVPISNPAPLVRVRLICRAVVGTCGFNVSNPGMIGTQRNFVSYQTYDLLSRGYRYPATFTAVKGLSAGQQIVISYFKNYSVVPDAETSKNVSVAHKEYKNEMDLTTAEETVANPQSGFKFVYKLPDYENLTRNLSVATDRDGAILTSSGFGKKLWGGIKKAVKTLAPALGMGVTALTKNPAIGGWVSDRAASIQASGISYECT